MKKNHQVVFNRQIPIPSEKMFLVILLLAFTILPGVSAPLVTAYRAGQPPRLDGVLDDPCWQAASLCQPFLSLEGRDLDTQNHARICWDDTHVYIAFECFERFLDPVLQQTARVTAEQKQHDSSVFSDDCIEVFLDIPGAGLFQFAANSIGTRYESKDGDANWNCDWQAQALRGKDRYTVECAIPLAALGVKSLEGAEWRGNFCRERKAVPENTTWSGLQGAFNDRGQYGTIRFAAVGPALGATRVTPAAEGPWRLEAEITPAGAATSLVMTLTLITGEKAVASLSKPVGTNAGGPAKITLDLALPPEARSARKLEYAYELKASSGVVYASPKFHVEFVNGKAVLSLIQAPEVVCQAFLDGRPVQSGSLKLHEGLNVLTLVASGKGGWVLPEIVIGPQRLPADERWLCTTAEPPADWQTAARVQGFQPAKTVGQGIWAAEQAAGKVYFRRGLWMTPPRGRIFPNTNKVWLPAGTSQRLKPYLFAATGQDLGEYSLCLRVPSYLRYVVADGIEGAKPREVMPVGTEELNGHSYTIYRAIYTPFPGSGMELSLRWARADGSTITYQPGIQGGGTFDWTHFTTTVTAPAGAAMLHPLVIKWQDRDITGTFWVDNITVRKKDSREELLKVGDFEGPDWKSDCVIAGQGKGGSKGVHIVSTPPIANKQQAVCIPEKPVVKVTPGMEYVIEMDAKAENLASSKASPLASLLFAVDPKAPQGPDAIYLNFELGGGNVTEVAQEVEVEVLPPLLGIRPRKIKIVPAAYKDYSAPVVMAALVDNFWRSGMSDIFGYSNNELVRLLRQKGKCESILQLDYAPFYAPSSMPDLLKQHPEAAAIEYPDKRSANRMCPTWTLTEGQEVLAALERDIAAQVISAQVKDGLHEGAVWDVEDPVVDPPTYCFCPRCFEAFRGEAKLPPDLKLTAPMMLKE
ncbi:MAG: carbohydrate-binding family 9-like protein, partial [Verrucomicrobia bacterium]|nr:carbohydrate-binding family 9-like protein [Verrucomicrobiota bacterium]